MALQLNTFAFDGAACCRCGQQSLVFEVGNTELDGEYYPHCKPCIKLLHSFAKVFYTVRFQADLELQRGASDIAEWLISVPKQPGSSQCKYGKRLWPAPGGTKRETVNDEDEEEEYEPSIMAPVSEFKKRKKAEIANSRADPKGLSEGKEDHGFGDEEGRHQGGHDGDEERCSHEGHELMIQKEGYQVDGGEGSHERGA